MRPISSSEMAWLVRSYNFVVLGDSWTALNINMGYSSGEFRGSEALWVKGDGGL
jgi:hypothetical protein